ncbi:MAG: YdeI/OmpD-associated family protein [Candidatus Dojkabacteria bacterium]|nr:MAG: YdeI/OmpD-associated family protein [Candidatus Dojkabacteria bacterium]
MKKNLMVTQPSSPSEEINVTVFPREFGDVHVFHSSADFRNWLSLNHHTVKELWVGYYKKDSKNVSMTYKEAVLEALCFGWIDGIVKSVSAEVYANRYTPRKPKSNWSNVNIASAHELIKQKRMTPAGLKAFELRDKANNGAYSFEQAVVTFSKEYETKLKANKKAWEFFESQSAYYKRTAIWYVISAKRQETRDKRLNELITDSAAGLKIKSLRVL